jgi:transcriptional regulator with XRE-family HTH domain
MRISDLNTDEAVLSELGARLARTRLEQNRSQEQVAAAAGISKRTLERIEAGASVQVPGLLRVLRALGLLERLDGLVPEPLPSPIDQLKREGRRRQRARSSRDPEPRPWTWGDE